MRQSTEAARGVPREWCDRYKLPKSITLSVPRIGDSAAATIALEWCSRLQHYFNIWHAQPNEAYTYSAADIVSYEESVEWRSFVAGLEPGSPAALRAETVRLLAPQHS